MRLHEYRLIRQLYFRQVCLKDIAKYVNISPRKVKTVITNNMLVRKRDRYYKFLVNYAYSHNEQLEDIGKRLGINVLSLRRVKRLFGISTKRFSVFNKRITPEIEESMVLSYLAGNTAQEVAKEHNYKTSKTVEDVLKKHEIACRQPRMRCKLDYSYFERIDSHDKAYILGLLYTDGYIYKDYCGVCIQLTESDRYLLERIAFKIGPAVTVIDVNCECKRKIMPNAKNMSRLGVYSKTLAEQVRELGVVRNKTYCLRMTNRLPDEFLYSFMRGIIDGDGTIGIYRNYPVCKFSTISELFAKDVCDLPFVERLRFGKSSNGMCNVYVTGGSCKIFDFIRKMYEHKSDLYLLRKYEKVQNQIV
jgi:AraC-like DNA-binding protein